MRKLYDGNVLTMTATAIAVTGDVIEFENNVGVVITAGVIGDTISVDTVGVYEFDATDADSFDVGTVCYWDSATKKATTVSTDNALLGTAWSVKAGGSADDVVEVKIG